MSINPTQGVIQPQVATGGQSGNANQPATEQQATLPTFNKAVAPAAVAATSKTAAQHEAQVKEAVQQLNDFMKHFSTTLNFTIDSDTKQIVVKVLNQQTGELIRQIPSEEALKLAKAADSLKGLIISAKV